MVEKKSVVGQGNDPSDVVEKQIKPLFLLQYKRKSSEHFAKALHICNPPCTVVTTLRKLRTDILSLEPNYYENVTY